jgi:hypothetical protein
VIGLPLSAMRLYSLFRPAMLFTSLRLKRAWVPKMLPVRRWQSRQWHIEIRTGSPSTVMRSWPQAHVASRPAIPLLPAALARLRWFEA